MSAEMRTCKECGATFESVRGKIYCSRTCEHRHNQAKYRAIYVSPAKLRAQRERKRDEMKRRLAARDAAFAAAFPQLVTGERRGRVSCARGRLRGHLDQFHPTI